MVAPAIGAAAGILTAIGRYGIPYLVRQAQKQGVDKFVQTYGNEAYTAISESLNLPMVNQDNIPMVNPNFNSDNSNEEDDNLPMVRDQQKTNQPQQEPPQDKGPNLGTEVAIDTALELSKNLPEEENIKSQTDKLISKTKNKIQTWEKYFDSKEEAEQVAKENNITLKDLEIPAIKKQITFKKTGDGFDIYFDKKYVGELADITQFKREDGSQRGNERTFNMFLIDENGHHQRDAITTIDGLKYAKEDAKDIIAKDLLRDTTEPLYPSLKDIFQNLEYNKNGRPKEVFEESERMRKLLERNKKGEP
jgi:hypothetical protein